MGKVVGNMTLLEILVYLDNLIMFGRILEEHDTRLLKTLVILEAYGFKLSLDKCQVCQLLVIYMLVTLYLQREFPSI